MSAVGRGAPYRHFARGLCCALLLCGLLHTRPPALYAVCECGGRDRGPARWAGGAGGSGSHGRLWKHGRCGTRPSAQEHTPRGSVREHVHEVRTYHTIIHRGSHPRRARSLR